MANRPQREPRRPVRLSVRYRTDEGWSEAQLRNLSSRGAMAVCASPPRRGTYVEVKRGACILVGRVVWASENSFGLQTQDHVDLTEMIGSSGVAQTGFGRRGQADPEAGRPPHARDLSEMADASLRLSRKTQFFAVALILAIAGLGIAHAAASVLSSPLSAALNVLRQHSD